MKYKISTLVAGLLMTNAVSAATAIDLHHQPAAYLQRQLTQQRSAALTTQQSQIKQVRAYRDFNHTTHTRIQQTFSGIPVWHATGVLHTPHATSLNMMSSLSAKTSMHGIVYEGLEKDLKNTPAYAKNDAQKLKALQLAKNNFIKFSGNVSKTTNDSAKQIIYIDEHNVAHYAWLVSFLSDDGLTGAHRPTTIFDATTLQVYRQWDQVLTTGNPLDSEAAKAAINRLNYARHHASSTRDGEYDIIAGGISGNEKTGEVTHDGAEGNQSTLNVTATDFTYEEIPGQPQTMTICALMNEDIIVTDVSYGDMLSYGTCFKSPKIHHGVAWLSINKNMTRWSKDEMNGGYSPAIDAFAAAELIKNFYRDWYDLPALVEEDGTTPMPLVMRVHYGRQYDNAFWDGEVMTFGDGGTRFFPLTSIGVAAHEISHGFTSQHSNIDYSFPQMGALHESFSDMAAVAVHYYQTKTNVWEIGRDIMKGEGALRYLDEPTKDGHSIDHMKDFDNTESHAGAGVFNKAFYLIATTEGWDIQKAFNVMIKANMHYWTSSMQTMAEAACGVLAATNDYHYNIADVRVAFSKVGIDTDQCDVH